ncbi:hypothetical protein WPS_01180 [Vulcanimicrobium alpinum]|uniref:Uncharacterized protein n=1 Tax=Vulcanimicrobium alpinum TaxID=3016050 RepID=A0AAN2C8S2_UNVUL|nr:hypothetical protein [Vulcanimicrobium alpinum]BDE04842.1 hypothetical protein WPS_01180 [Vulcanimicrobium alpinum]
MAFDAAVIAAHAAAIRRGSWFALAGLPFSDDERAAAARLAPRVERVTNWKDARALANDPRANAARDADARDVVMLKDCALASTGPDVLLEAMSAVVDNGLEIFMAHAVAALARARIADEELARVAAGAAADAVYRGALASAVGLPEHRFVLSEALFASGRWPLARIGETAYVL